MGGGVSGHIEDEFSELSGMIARAEAEADQALAARSTPEALKSAMRARKRRRLTAAVVGLLIAAVIGTYLPITLLAPVGATAAVVDTKAIAPGAPVALELPEVGASAVSVSGIEQFGGTTDAGGIFAASGGSDPRPIASITKLIAALVILESKPLGPAEDGPTITFSKADADLYDHYYVMRAKVHEMPRGSTMSERDALEIMLVISATNYADAVSRWAFGSLNGFRAATAQWLAAHGLTGTHIVEPTGMDARNTSTPADLLAIGKIAMADPVVSQIVKTRSVRGWPNTNALVGIDGINGIKTGTLDAAGACLLFSAVMDVGAAAPITVIGVVLGGDNHYQVDNAVRALLASIRGGFHEVPLVAEGDVVGSYVTTWGEQAQILAGADASVLTWSDQAITSEISAAALTTASDGTVVGTLRFAAGHSEIDVPVKLRGIIEGPDGWWRVTHPGELLGGD